MAMSATPASARSLKDAEPKRASLISAATLRRAYFASLIVIATALIATQAPRFEGNVWLFGALVAIEVVAGLRPIVIYGKTSQSVGFVLVLAIVILFGPPGAAILAPLSAVCGRLGRRKVDEKIVTNAALFTIVYCAAAGGYNLLADVGPENVSIAVVAGAALATAISFGLSFVLLSIPFYLDGTHSFSDFWDRNSWVLPHYGTMGLIGLALTAGFISAGLLGLLAFAAPVLMMRFSIKQYVDKTQENVKKLETQNASLEKAYVQIRSVSDELRESYDGTLEALVNALDARDQETKGHSLRVSRYMMDIARELGVKPGTQDWTDMQRGSLLHDVGKIGVSDSILLKPGKLTDDEWSSMRRHPEIGYNMLRQVRFLQGAAEIVLAHHERWDGKGYPKQLHEDEVPLGARIFTVVDTFDSMTSDRPYRKAKSTLDALNEILRCSGSQFDPSVVEAFLDIYETWVKQRDRLHADTEGLRIAA